MPRAAVTSCLLLLAACGALPPRPLPPVPAAASEVFAEARRLDREGRAEEALEAARSAAGLAPDWVAPRRYLDDRARARLRTPELLAGYRAHLAARPDDAAALYLTGRLEGRAGQARLLAARRLDPSRGWAWHGLGWNAHARGARAEARRLSRRAVQLARDPYERAYFGWARARIELAAGEEDLAADLLAELAGAPDTDEGDRVWLEVELARLELRSSEAARRRRGAHRALALLESAPLIASEAAALVDGLSVWGRVEPGRAALHLALARRGLLRERGALLRDEQPSALALALLDEDAGEPGASSAQDPALRQLRFTHGDPAEEVRAWVRALPAFLRDGERPRDPDLAELWDAAEALGPPAGWTPTAARRFGAALLNAGWFREAQAFAARVPCGERDLALGLDERARAGRGVVDELVRLGHAFDRDKARRAPQLEAGGDDGAEVRDLEGLLAALAPSLARASWFLGGPTDPREWEGRLRGSAQIDYGLVGEVLHPGPSFTELDEEAGLGQAGEPVEGWAATLGSLGRFGLFGQGLGQPVDGALLRRVWIEEREGAHLGVPWSGTIAWCDGADLSPRLGRSGARIAGAALHEGYWIDLAVLRAERERWVELLAAHPDGGVAALAVTPLRPEEGEEVAGTTLLLGAADRLRLAVMRDLGGPPPLEVLCEVTAVHEEGHLCDRTLFFPLADHWARVLGFLASTGFSPQVVAERLEERAQLIALCGVGDPRVPLVDLLSAAEAGGGGPTPHGNAYARLCEQFLEELAVQLEAGAVTGLDPAAFLGQQVHVLDGEQVRGVALALARRRGLVRE